MAIGLLEVEERARELKQLKRKKLKAEIEEHPIEVIVNPRGNQYIIDGHHRVFAYWILGVESVPTEIKYRFPAKTTHQKFWKKMRKEKWVHPYNESGDGPIDSIYLARDIRGVGNDPYRSLAWLVHESGGYAKTNVTFADFEWAQFFRRKKLLHCHFSPHFKRVLPLALKLAKSKACSRLPGYQK